MNLIKAWRAHRKSVTAGKAARIYLEGAKMVASDTAKADEWKAFMTLANLCLESQLVHQREFEEAIK